MSELPDNPISATVDFNREGVQHGFLKLPYSGTIRPGAR
jgi:N-alpha-acetyl-L-2,4-diaminobutyrate deacetylase